MFFGSVINCQSCLPTAIGMNVTKKTRLVNATTTARNYDLTYSLSMIVVLSSEGSSSIQLLQSIG